MKGPEAYLRGLGIELEGVVDPTQPALLTPEHRTTVNGHFFWVSDAERLAAFRARAHAYTGPLLDPVEHTWFEPGEGSPRRDVRGEILYFATAESAARFDAGSGVPVAHIPGHLGDTPAHELAWPPGPTSH